MLVRSIPLALVVAVLGIATMHSPAIAGDFEVMGCQQEALGRWQGTLNHASVALGNPCAVWVRMGPSPAPAGAAGNWSFTAYPGTWVAGLRTRYTIAQGSGWVAGVADSGQWYLGGPLCVGVCTGAGQIELGNLHTESIAIQMFCQATACRADGLYASASLSDAVVVLHDPSSPTLGNVRGSLWTGDWQSGRRAVTFDADDSNTGIARARILIDGRVITERGGDCGPPTHPLCDPWPGGQLEVLTSDGIPDGSHQLTVQVLDRGGNVAAADRMVAIDNTPPAGPQDVTVVGGAGWRQANNVELIWKNPPQPGRAPIAGAVYRLCPVDGSTKCVDRTVSGPGLTSIKGLQVPASGEWILRLWLLDAAGNAREETAAPPIRLGLDEDAPEVAMSPLSSEDPTKVSIHASDRTSPLSRGEVELRREGTRTWHSMHGERTKAGFEARIADEELPDGRYEMRARVFDSAGNERSADRFTTGEPAQVTLPVRIRSRLVAGRSGRRICRGRGKRRHCRRRLNAKPSVRYRRPVRLRGRLTLPGRRPLSRTEVEVWEQVQLQGAPMRRLSSVRTSRTGRFRFRVPAGPARVIRFRYPGTKTIRPRNADVRLRVRASTSLRVSDRRVVNGEYVTFRGRVRGRPLPASGKLVELQAYSRGGWRTFAQPRASARTGRWAYRYRFQATRGRVQYRIRARVRQEATYPFHMGTSRPVHVTVVGL